MNKYEESIEKMADSLINNKELLKKFLWSYDECMKVVNKDVFRNFDLPFWEYCCCCYRVKENEDELQITKANE